MKHDAVELDGIILSIVMDVESIVVSINQLQAFLHIRQSYTSMLLVTFIVLAVGASEVNSFVCKPHFHVYIGFFLITDAMFKSVFNKGNEKHGRNGTFGYGIGNIHIDFHLVGVSYFH